MPTRLAMPLALSRAGEPYKKINPLHQKAAHSSEKRQLLPLNQNRPGFQQKVKIYNLEAEHGMLQDFFISPSLLLRPGLSLLSGSDVRGGRDGCSLTMR